METDRDADADAAPTKPPRGRFLLLRVIILIGCLFFAPSCDCTPSCSLGRDIIFRLAGSAICNEMFEIQNTDRLSLAYRITLLLFYKTSYELRVTSSYENVKKTR